MNNGIKILCSLFILISFSGCQRQAAKSATTGSQQHSIAFYNLENLFDIENDPAIDDEEFLPDSDKEWDNMKYQAKLLNLSSVIAELGDANGPELLGVCEIENRKVLEDLIAMPAISDYNYGIVHFNSPDRRGIDVGLIYKKDVFRPISSRSLRVSFSNPEIISRDVLMVKGLFLKDTVTVFVNHWPSRRGGAEASEVNRTTVAKVVREQVDSLLSRNPQAKVLLMGDFNDEPSDVSISQVLNATAEAGQLAQGQLYNTFGKLHQQEKGSYMYRGKYDMIDQIILSQSWLQEKSPNYVAESASIYMPEEIQETDPKYKGAPLRTYAGKKYLGGFSDHFPVYIHVTGKK